MAKVTNPLHSESASGKLANSIVFFTWKGRNVVRKWLKPANPMTENQGDVRLAMSCAGKACSKITINENYAGQLNTLGVIPGGQTKQSFTVKAMIDTFLYNPVTKITPLETEVTAYLGHTHKAAFDAGAIDLGLDTQSISYAGTTAVVTGGFMVYMLARLAIYLKFTGAPYVTALVSWNTTEVAKMVDDLIGA